MSSRQLYKGIINASRVYLVRIMHRSFETPAPTGTRIAGT